MKLAVWTDNSIRTPRLTIISRKMIRIKIKNILKIMVLLIASHSTQKMARNLIPKRIMIFLSKNLQVETKDSKIRLDLVGTHPMDMAAAAKDWEEWQMWEIVLFMEQVSLIFIATQLSHSDVQQAEVSKIENGRKPSQICFQILTRVASINKEKVLEVVKILQMPLHLQTMIQKTTLNQASEMNQFKMSKSKTKTQNTIRLFNLKIVWWVQDLQTLNFKVPWSAIGISIKVSALSKVSLLSLRPKKFENKEKMMWENCITELPCFKVRKKKHWKELKKHVLRPNKCLSSKSSRKKTREKECNKNTKP